MSPLESFTKWLKLKIYQLEVTFSVYIFTPLEKFIFYSVLFLLVSLTFIASILYLPRHTAFIIGRAWFYMHGDLAEATKGAGAVVRDAVESLGTTAAALSGSITSGDATTTVAEATEAIAREL